MRKLKLDLDPEALEVSSFVTTPEGAEARGGVESCINTWEKLRDYLTQFICGG